LAFDPGVDPLPDLPSNTCSTCSPIPILAARRKGRWVAASLSAKRRPRLERSAWTIGYRRAALSQRPRALTQMDQHSRTALLAAFAPINTGFRTVVRCGQAFWTYRSPMVIGNRTQVPPRCRVEMEITHREKGGIPPRWPGSAAPEENLIPPALKVRKGRPFKLGCSSLAQ
jgi:hypothetical protein